MAITSRHEPANCVQMTDWIGASLRLFSMPTRDLKPRLAVLVGLAVNSLTTPTAHGCYCKGERLEQTNDSYTRNRVQYECQTFYVSNSTTEVGIPSVIYSAFSDTSVSSDAELTERRG